VRTGPAARPEAPASTGSSVFFSYSSWLQNLWPMGRRIDRFNSDGRKRLRLPTIAQAANCFCNLRYLWRGSVSTAASDRQFGAHERAIVLLGDADAPGFGIRRPRP